MQFIWCGNQRCEAEGLRRHAPCWPNTSPEGKPSAAPSYYFTKDHLGSVREMTNSSGTIVWQQSFDPYGQPTTLVSTTPADFGLRRLLLPSEKRAQSDAEPEHTAASAGSSTETQLQKLAASICMAMWPIIL